MMIISGLKITHFFSLFIPRIYSLMETVPVTCLKQIFFTVRMEEGKGSDKSLKAV